MSSVFNWTQCLFYLNVGKIIATKKYACPIFLKIHNLLVVSFFFLLLIDIFQYCKKSSRASTIINGNWKQPRCWHTVDCQYGKQVQHNTIWLQPLISLKDHRRNCVRFSDFSNKSKSCIFIQNFPVLNIGSKYMNTHICRPYTALGPVYCC